MQKELHLNDVVEVALDAKTKSQTIIHMIKRMKSEIAANYFDNPSKELCLNDLYRIFVQRRKVKLLRFLFSLQNEFNFTPSLFIEALELESYDIAALLHKEFFRRLRESKLENEYIITILISAVNRNNGQIDFKAYLLRAYIE